MAVVRRVLALNTQAHARTGLGSGLGRRRARGSWGDTGHARAPRILTEAFFKYHCVLGFEVRRSWVQAREVSRQSHVTRFAFKPFFLVLGHEGSYGPRGREERPTPLRLAVAHSWSLLQTSQRADGGGWPARVTPGEVGSFHSKLGLLRNAE